MSRFAMVLGLLVAVGCGAAGRAADAPAKKPAVDIKAGESYVEGVLVVPRNDKRAVAPPLPKHVYGGFSGGFDKRELTGDRFTAKDYFIKRPTTGLAIYDLKPNDSLLAKRLRVGDMIYEVAGKRVGTPREFASAIEKAADTAKIKVHSFTYGRGWSDEVLELRPPVPPKP